MSAMKKPYTILVGIDFSPLSDLALDRAFELASKEQGAELHVVHVARSQGPLVLVDVIEGSMLVSMEELAGKLRAHVETRTQEFVTQRGPTAEPPFARAVTHIRLDAAAEEVAQLALDLDVDLVVVGTHGRRGLRRLLLGSVAEGVVRRAPCPVLVVRPRGAEDQPGVEPPCPDCVRERLDSRSHEYWCERHRERHGPRRVFHTLGAVSRERESLPDLSIND